VDSPQLKTECLKYAAIHSKREAAAIRFQSGE
jgi:hypothetical protein